MKIFSFKSTGGVTRDQFGLFDNSTTAKFWRDTAKISTFLNEIFSFLRRSGNFGLGVTLKRFDSRHSSAARVVSLPAHRRVLKQGGEYMVSSIHVPLSIWSSW
jgi:hypothetical protein